MYYIFVNNLTQIDGNLIIFGGSGGDKSFNDIHKFDLNTGKWNKIEATGEIPNPREGHIALQYGKDKMIIHGGVDQSEISYNDVYILTGINKAVDS